MNSSEIKIHFTLNGQYEGKVASNQLLKQKNDGKS